MRFPLCPRPEPLELISSWLRRVAYAHGLVNEDHLLAHIQPTDEYQTYHSSRPQLVLDLFTPPKMLARISEVSGVPKGTLSRMTLAHWVPSLALPVPPANRLFADYIRGFEVLRQSERSGEEYARQWLFERRFPAHPWQVERSFLDRALICRLCVDRAGFTRFYLPWACGLTASCPWHEVELSPSFVVTPGRRAKLTADWFTMMALRRDQVLLPSGAVVTGKWWFRFLRAVIEEVYYLRLHINPPNFVLDPRYELIWRLSGGAMPRAPRTFSGYSYFELEGQEERLRYLKAASVVVDLLIAGAIRPPPRSRAWLLCPR